jgi:hypothetical protein
LQYLGLSIAELRENALNKNGEPTSHWLGLYNTLVGKKKRENSDEWTWEQMDWYFTYLKKNLKVYDNDDDLEGREISYLEFLRNYRIELDTVVNIVGAEKFWEWLKKQILEVFETRDYNRAITIPRYVPTPTMEEFQEKLENTIEAITKDRIDEIAQELRTVNELINTEDKLEEIKTDLLDNYILEDPKVKEIDSTLKKLIKGLD